MRSLKKTARNWKNEVAEQIGSKDEAGEIALVAWKVVGGLALLLALWLFVQEIPAMIREVRILRM
jgi:hypothetical protein